jgi:hypothetical protein
VGLEPSCIAALRHDAPGLLADDPMAAAVAAATQTFAEFVNQSGWAPPEVGGEALVQTHCQQHTVMGFEADRAVMAAAGITASVPVAECCGLAGNSVPSAATIRCRRPPGSASFCLPCVTPHPPRRSSPTASAAEPRSPTARLVSLSTSPSYWADALRQAR